MASHCVDWKKSTMGLQCTKHLLAPQPTTLSMLCQIETHAQAIAFFYILLSTATTIFFAFAGKIATGLSILRIKRGKKIKMSRQGSPPPPPTTTTTAEKKQKTSHLPNCQTYSESQLTSFIYVDIMKTLEVEKIRPHWNNIQGSVDMKIQPLHYNLTQFDTHYSVDAKHTFL